MNSTSPGGGVGLQLHPLLSSALLLSLLSHAFETPNRVPTRTSIQIQQRRGSSLDLACLDRGDHGRRQSRPEEEE